MAPVEGSESRRRRVAIYARVSTCDQSPEMQLRELREMADRRGWVVVAEYVDHGVSGKRARRPSLDRLMDDARKRRFDILCIWKLDRLARSVRHLLQISEELESLGIDFFSATESLDTTTPQGRMLFTILGAIAEFERDLACERIRAGMRNAKAKGRRLGRPALEPSEKEIDELVELRRKGVSIRRIADTVVWFPSNDGPARHPSPSLVHRWVKSLEESGKLPRACGGKGGRHAEGEDPPPDPFTIPRSAFGNAAEGRG